MHSKRKILKSVLASLIIFLSSCRGVQFDPDFYVVDSTKEALINEEGEEILCSEPRAELFACMSEEKIMELKEILSKCRLPEEYYRESGE